MDSPLMVPMELLQNIYGVLGIILLRLVFWALLVAAFAAKRTTQKGLTEPSPGAVLGNG
jgi:hypothetical protein